MIITRDIEKAFEKIKDSFHLKKKKKRQDRNQGEGISQPSGHIYEKSMVNVVLNGEKD